MSLDNVLGKAGIVDGLPLLQEKIISELSNEQELFYLNIGYLTDLLDDNGKLKEVKKDAEGRQYIEGFSGSESELVVMKTAKLYELFENMTSQRRISHALTPSGGIALDEVATRKQITSNPSFYLLGELISYLRDEKKIDETIQGITNDNAVLNSLLGHNTGLKSYFANAYSSVKTRTEGKVMKDIDSALKDGNLKPLLTRCKIIAEDTRCSVPPEKKFSVEDEYIMSLLTESAERVYDSITEDSKGATFKPAEGEVAKTVAVYLMTLNKSLESIGISGFGEYIANPNNINHKISGFFRKGEDTVMDLERQVGALALEH